MDKGDCEFSNKQNWWKLITTTETKIMKKKTRKGWGELGDDASNKKKKNV